MNDAHTSLPTFKTISGDPIEVHEHKLANGLTLFLSVNREQPRIYTEIPVRVGSKHDPADTTGLAHYFEHMMFKGTDQLGSLDWDKEKALLDEIEQRFEEHRAETDPERKRALYAEIDRLSFEAARYAAANEYDKMASAIGAKSTNAYTWVEQTVYVNDIPANELGRWFALESERFRRPVLRLFHTELETVFEEYNMSQDRDIRKTMKALQETLTPTHPYGTQTTLGRGEDLKNPSQTNIYRFFDRYYVPNNMAIVLCGDFDPAEAVALAERHFGHLPAKPLPAFHFDPQPALTKRTLREVYGNEAPWVEIGWRLPGANSPEARLLPLLANVLHNQAAGIFDLNLMQKQQLLEVYAYPRIYEDYSSLLLYAKPREGQSHEQVEQLLMEQMEALRQGDFAEWLPEAVLRDLKFSEIRQFDKNQGRASAITGAYILGIPWHEMVGRWEQLKQVTKADLVAFAQQHLRPDNCAVVYKHGHPDNNVMKVEKPPITAVELNRTDASAFAREFLAVQPGDIAPEFVDFKKAIQTTKLAPKIKLQSVTDPRSKQFRLYYTFDMGRAADRRLSTASGYLPFLGTSRYTASEVQQAFFRLGAHFSATCQNEHFYLTLNGLEESFEASVELMEHLLADLQPNADALENLVADTLLRRENNKKDKQTVLKKALLSYAKYGPVSPYTTRLSKEELLALRPEELTDLLRSLTQYRHEVFYYGPHTAKKAAETLRRYRQPVADPLSPLKGRRYPERNTRPEVLFVDFPMVQVDLMLLSKGTSRFDLEEHLMTEWYNQYFGYGLSSIIFQEIRESKALAYSAYAVAATPDRKNRAHYLQCYVGTQPDKLREAVEAFQTLLEEMPVIPSQIETARQSVLKQIAAGRIAKSDLYWTLRTNSDRGLPRDLRADMYQRLQQARPEDLLRFQQERMRNRDYVWLVMGERDRIDFNYLSKIGRVRELTLEQIFGY